MAEKTIQNQILNRERRIPYPVQCTFELTPRCNFKCKMCYVRLDPDEIPSRGRELTAAEWIRLGEQAVDAGTLFLTITGGEPLIRPDFAEIYTALTEMGFWIAIQTNLSLIDDKIMALLEERPPKFIKSTIYGASDETYERVCGIKNGLTKVEQGIQAVQKAKIPLQLVSTIIHDNNDDLEGIYQLAQRYGIPLQHTHRVLDSTRNANHENIVSSRMRRRDFAQNDCSEIQVQQHTPLSSPLDLCGEYKKGGYWIFWDGSMSFCSHIRMPFHPLESSIENCFSSMYETVEKQYASGVCSGCSENKVCRLCPAMLYTEHLEAGMTCKNYNNK